MPMQIQPGGDNREGASAPSSPLWSATTKIIIGLTAVAVVAVLLINARSLIGPLLLVVVVIYLLRPIAHLITRWVPIGWKLAVTLVFLAVLALLGIGVLFGGSVVITQVASVVSSIQMFLTQLPALAADTPIPEANLNALIEQAAQLVQPILGSLGVIITGIASTTISTVGWGLLMLLVSYFLLLDLNPASTSSIFMWLLSDSSSDGRQLARNVDRIWSAFLNGQGVLFLLTVGAYVVMLTVLGVQNVLILALIAGFTRFVPYLGAPITWIVTGVVALLQGSNYLGLAPFAHVLLVLVIIIAFDETVDYVIGPRLFARVLNLHPVAVLLATFVWANLIGVIGVLLAAPLLATLVLVGSYVIRKLGDREPWPAPKRVAVDTINAAAESTISEQARSVI